jgi:hypothetical protein
MAAGKKPKLSTQITSRPTIAKLYACATLDDVKDWLSCQDAAACRIELLAAVKKLLSYQNAPQWNQLVLVCEALALVGWGKAQPLEAYCGKSLSGSWETGLRNAQ